MLATSTATSAHSDTTSGDPSVRSPDTEVIKIDLDHTLEPKEVFQTSETNGIQIISVELAIGNGGGHYQYDPAESGVLNAESLQNEVDSLSGTEAVITSIEIDASSSSKSTQDRSVSSETKSKAPNTEQFEEVFSELPETKPTDANITGIKDDIEKESTSASPQLAKASAVGAETKAHANRVVFRTDDDVNGRRKVSFDAAWKDASNIKSAPNDWGFEVELYQHNYKLSSKVVRPACPADTDDRYWADARLHGATVVYTVNNGISSSQLSKIETYLDNNHWSDPCSQGGIGFGIGKPKSIPTWDSKVDGKTTHQEIYVTMSLKKGKASWSNVHAASSFVKNNCTSRAHTDCMGLSGKWPASSMGGDSDMLLLNENRKWKTPTYFSWDAYADKRPKALTRM